MAGRSRSRTSLGGICQRSGRLGEWAEEPRLQRGSVDPAGVHPLGGRCTALVVGIAPMGDFAWRDPRSTPLLGPEPRRGGTARHENDNERDNDRERNR